MTVKTTYEPFKYEAGKNFEIFKSRNLVDVQKCIKYICLILDCEESDLDNEKPYEFNFKENCPILSFYSKNDRIYIDIKLNTAEPVSVFIRGVSVRDNIICNIVEKSIFKLLLKYEILKKEHVPYFEKFVVLGKRMMIQEIVEILSNYHRVPEENILDAFFNLRKTYEIEGATASFSEGVANALAIYYYDKDGKILSHERINRYYGKPLSHIG